MKCPDWIESWKEQYSEDADCDVVRAEIKIVMKRANGEIVIRHSEYRTRSYKEQNQPNNGMSNEHRF